jgi:hypothetical protein
VDLRIRSGGLAAPWRLGLALCVALGGVVASPAQAPRPDPVEELRLALQGSCRDVEARDRAVKECLGALRTLNDLRRALTLSDWRDRHPVAAVAASDAANREAVAERFFAGVREVLEGGEAAAIQKTLDLLVELAEKARTKGGSSATVRPLGPDVAALVRKGAPALRGPAAWTLGQIDPDLSVALPALSELLRTADPALRQAAVEGLAGLLQSVAEDIARPLVNGPTRSTQAEMAARAAEVLPVVGRGLNDWHLGVRRRAIGVVHTAAAALSRMISDPLTREHLEGTEAELLRQAAEAERARLRPLVEALAAHGPALALLLREGNSAFRLQVQQALEEVAYARERWLRQRAALDALAEPNGDDPLADGLRAAVPRLAAAVADPDPRIQRSAIDILDLLGPLAAPAGKALARALEDSDRFVRWSAARALGHLGPEAVGEAIPRLQNLLADPDPDVRRAATNALSRMRPSR